MPVEIGRVVREGLERTASRNGLTFVAFTYVLAVLGWSVATSVAESPPSESGLLDSATQPPSLDISPLVAVAGVLVLLLIFAAVVAAALRTFVADETGTIPLGRFTRNYPRMAANLATGWIAYTVLVSGLWLVLGLLLLVGGLGALSGGVWGLVVLGVAALSVPVVLFLVGNLYFWYIFVVVQDRGFVDAFASSWTLTKGHRPRLFVLGIVVWAVNTTVSIVTAGPAFVLPQPAGFLLTRAGTAVVAVFTLATTARTYVQLTDGGSESVTVGTSGSRREIGTSGPRDLSE